MADFVPAQADLYQAILRRFRAAQIGIPFPQLDPQVVSGNLPKTA